MNRMVRLLLPLFVLAAFLSSCEFTTNDIEYNMGDHFIDDPANVFMIDTMTVKSYSVVADSIVTSQAERLLTGRYINEYGVETLCESYLRFDPTTSPNLSENESAEYDSACFVIYTDRYTFGDTSVVAGFNVYRLTQQIEFDEDFGYLFNTSKFQTEEEPVGSFSVNFNTDVDSILVSLPDSFGKELYDMVYNEEEMLEEVNIDGVSEFKNEFLKGFKIAPKDENESVIFGMQAYPDSARSPRIDLFYHDNTVNDNLAISFGMESINNVSGVFNSYAFTHIENDYTGSIFESNEPGEALEGVEDKSESKYPAHKSNEITISQAGYLHSTRIEIPYVHNLYDYGKGAIVKAELIIDPIDDSFENEQDLPSVLQMDIVDEDNDKFDALYEVGEQNLALGELMYDPEFKSKTHYRFDITNFIKTEYEDFGTKEYSLLLLTPYNSSEPDVDQLVIGSPDNKENPMKLKVYLTNF